MKAPASPSSPTLGSRAVAVAAISTSVLARKGSEHDEKPAGALIGAAMAAWAGSCCRPDQDHRHRLRAAPERRQLALRRSIPQRRGHQAAGIQGCRRHARRRHRHPLRGQQERRQGGDGTSPSCSWTTSRSSACSATSPAPRRWRPPRSMPRPACRNCRRPLRIPTSSRSASGSSATSPRRAYEGPVQRRLDAREGRLQGHGGRDPERLGPVVRQQLRRRLQGQGRTPSLRSNISIRDARLPLHPDQDQPRRAGGYIPLHVL